MAISACLTRSGRNGSTGVNVDIIYVPKVGLRLDGD
jgi:hypothetical protein